MSTAPDVDLEPGAGSRLVRTCSDELSRERDKRPAELRDQWNLFLLESHEIAVRSVLGDEAFLLEQSRKLYAAWDKFCKRLPPDQARDISTGLPSLQKLRDSVMKASESWQERRKESKFGRLKDRFSNLCKTVEDHSALLSVVPSNDKYVTLLTGSLTAIAQASMNHADIAEGVADALEELAQDMFFWDSVIQEHGHTKIIIRHIMELYVVVFEFLTQIFDEWSRSSWKRLVTSLNEGSFHKLFMEKRVRIRSIEQRMLRSAELKFQTNIKRAVNNMQTDFEHMIKHQKNSDLEQKNMILNLGAQVQSLLGQSIRYPQIEESQRIELSQVTVDEVVLGGKSQLHSKTQPMKLHSQTQQESEDAINNASNAISPLRVGTAQDEIHHFEREKILQCLSLGAEAYGRHISKVVNITRKAASIMVNSRVKQQVLDWISSTRSQALWIQGPCDGGKPSQNTLTAVCLVALSTQSKISCLSYFCRLASADTSSIPSYTPKKMLLDLTASLITQIVLLLPSQLSTTVDLSSDRFEQLNGTEEDFDFDHALQLLHDLRALMPAYVHCVIEGIELLEDREDSVQESNLQRLFKELSSSPGKTSEAGGNGLATPPSDPRTSREQRVVKVCFTTDGHMDGLAQRAEEGGLHQITYQDDSDHPWAEEGRRLMPLWNDDTEKFLT